MTISPEGVRGLGDAIAIMTAMRVQMELLEKNPHVRDDDALVQMLNEMRDDPLRLSCALTGLAALVINAVHPAALDRMIDGWVQHWLSIEGLS